MKKLSKGPAFDQLNSCNGSEQLAIDQEFFFTTSTM